MILEIFTTNKYDKKTAVTDGDNDYTFYDLKCLIASEMNLLKEKKNNVVILPNDNFAFIIQFFASLLCLKNIYLITDKTRLNNMNIDFDVIEGYEKKTNEIPKFNIDISKPLINFYTSGSSGKPKVIKKSLYNLICEAKDLGKELGLKNKNLNVISTTTMCHLFGLTFHLMMPLCNSLIINTKNVSYPENINQLNTILVSTPTFLYSVPKFDVNFKINPEYIITAGSKLNDGVFEYLEKKSKIIEIYGSTETGIIARKTHYADDFKLFDNVNLVVNKDNVEVKSEYFYEDNTCINDKIELNNRILKFKNRTDRLYKIYEKRINADELENNLKSNSFVKDCYITKHGEKLVCICALSDLGKKYLLKNNISSLIKNLKSYLASFSEISPKRWKFIDEIPMTNSGKINKKLIERLFNINLSLPVILDRVLSENSITYKLFFYHQCNFFNGHFPEFQLVPGVVQLYLAKNFANIHFNLSLEAGQWKKIKFSNTIKPDSIINLKLVYNEKQIYYEFYSDIKKYASGIFLCKNIFEGIL